MHPLEFGESLNQGFEEERESRQEVSRYGDGVDLGMEKKAVWNIPWL